MGAAATWASAGRASSADGAAEVNRSEGRERSATREELGAGMDSTDTTEDDGAGLAKPTERQRGTVDSNGIRVAALATPSPAARKNPSNRMGSGAA